MRYIDAEPLEQIAAAMINNYRQSGQEDYELPWHGKLLFITNAPTADVAPVVHGRWTMTQDGAAYCTACKRKMNSYLYGYAHCGLCGARMDGEEVDA